MLFNSMSTLTMTIDPSNPSITSDTSPIDYSIMTRRCSLYLDTLPLLESVDLQQALREYLPLIEPDLRGEALNVWLMTIRDYQYLAARLGWTSSTDRYPATPDTLTGDSGYVR